MQTFADWLCYYNDLDVAPGLEAVEKMRAFYTDKGMDVMKDAVSLRSELAFSLERHDGARGWTFSPSKEVYAVLKEAVVGGSDTYKTAPQAKTVCKRIIFYDANVLYLSTMLGEMPCAKERVVHYRNSAGLASMLTERLKARTRDVDRSKAALAEVFKQLGNSDYGKLIEALERQTGVIYTLDEAVDRSLRSAYFRELKELGQAN